MSIGKINGFIADVTAIKRGTHFWHPSVSIDDGWRNTSVKGLIDFLRAHYMPAAQMTLTQALQHCAVPGDDRILKYIPAIVRLVDSWGHPGNYPAGPYAAMPAPECKARRNFALALHNWPGVLLAAQPTWDALYNERNNSAGLGMGLGNPYLLRVPGPPAVDITARSLLLRAGLAPPAPGWLDAGYAARLQLDPRTLRAMQGASLLDVACGGAMFRSEMAILYNCVTHGIDMNAAHVAGAIAEGQRRYAKSMLYLKMLKDLGTPGVAPLPGGAGSLVDSIVGNLPAILTHYANNLPVAGNVLAAPGVFGAAVGVGNWDYCATTYLLCYFNAADQETAIVNMLNVTNRTLFVYNGSGNAVPSQTLIYNQANVRLAVPGCRIQVLDARTHHIHR